MKLRNMSASVNRVDYICVQTISGETVGLKNAYVLTSYNSHNPPYRVLKLSRPL